MNLESIFICAYNCIFYIQDVWEGTQGFSCKYSFSALTQNAACDENCYGSSQFKCHLAQFSVSTADCCADVVIIFHFGPHLSHRNWSYSSDSHCYLSLHVRISLHFCFLRLCERQHLQRNSPLFCQLEWWVTVTCHCSSSCSDSVVDCSAISLWCLQGSQWCWLGIALYNT
jgi:hypothetical protein